MKSRMERIQEFRRNQSIEELQRKWDKAKGRWSNSIWAAEFLDLAHARARIFIDRINWK